MNADPDPHCFLTILNSFFYFQRWPGVVSQTYPGG